jgi:hypothetical protein
VSILLVDLFDFEWREGQQQFLAFHTGRTKEMEIYE